MYRSIVWISLGLLCWGCSGEAEPDEQSPRSSAEQIELTEESAIEGVGDPRSTEAVESQSSSETVPVTEFAVTAVRAYFIGTEVRAIISGPEGTVISAVFELGGDEIRADVDDTERLPRVMLITGADALEFALPYRTPEGNDYQISHATAGQLACDGAPQPGDFEAAAESTPQLTLSDVRFGDVRYHVGPVPLTLNRLVQGGR